MRRLLPLGFFFLFVPAAVGAPDSKLDLTQRFLLLATTKTSTMQKELSEAAGAGYRILGASPTAGTEMVVILEKVATPPQVYEYLLLATTRTSTMQKELSEAAEKGFRLLPQTIIAKEQTFGGTEIVMLLEKPPGAASHYRYLLLATSRTSTMQKEMAQASDGGYKVVGMASRGEHLVILEKPVRPATR
jgi:queuine/archaeosine tRNA-ribosyltransferase